MGASHLEFFFSGFFFDFSYALRDRESAKTSSWNITRRLESCGGSLWTSTLGRYKLFYEVYLEITWCLCLCVDMSI